MVTENNLKNINQYSLRNKSRSKVFSNGNNSTERKLSAHAKQLGFVTMKNGWPDFMLFGENGEIIFVEVKSSNDKVRPEQFVMLALLHDLGVDVRISNGDDLGRNLTDKEIKIGHDLLWGECKLHQRSIQSKLPDQNRSWLKARVDYEVSKKILEYL